MSADDFIRKLKSMLVINPVPDYFVTGSGPGADKHLANYIDQTDHVKILAVKSIRGTTHMLGGNDAGRLFLNSMETGHMFDSAGVKWLLGSLNGRPAKVEFDSI